jgi:hypothetical protein
MAASALGLVYTDDEESDNGKSAIVLHLINTLCNGLDHFEKNFFLYNIVIAELNCSDVDRW